MWLKTVDGRDIYIFDYPNRIYPEYDTETSKKIAEKAQEVLNVIRCRKIDQMIKFKIKIWYSTGDSFNTEDTTGILEMSWENFEVAKANLKRIKEHYICYKVDTEYYGKKSAFFNQLSPEDKLMYDTRKQQDWYREVDNNYHYTIVLKTDAGTDWVISPFWIGYFENLSEGRIVTDDSETNFKLDF